MNYLWLKALHIIFMVTWFAGLFYLPRLFAYHAESSENNELTEILKHKFLTWQRKLFIIMSIGMVLTYVFGLWMLGVNTALFKMGWIHVKLTLVVLLTIYHFYCFSIHRKFREGNNTRSGKFYRLFNEIPALFLFGIIILAIVKPF